MNLLLSLLLAGSSAATDPCTRVERGIDDAAKAQLAPVIGRHIGVRGVRIDEALRSDDWPLASQGKRYPD